jgi:hypothetical protein
MYVSRKVWTIVHSPTFLLAPTPPQLLGQQ